jgi:hypothetical protein
MSKVPCFKTTRRATESGSSPDLTGRAGDRPINRPVTHATRPHKILRDEEARPLSAETCWRIGIWSWLLAAGCWLLAAGCWLVAYAWRSTVEIPEITQVQPYTVRMHAQSETSGCDPAHWRDEQRNSRQSETFEPAGDLKGFQPGDNGTAVAYGPRWLDVGPH